MEIEAKGIKFIHNNMMRFHILIIITIIFGGILRTVFIF